MSILKRLFGIGESPKTTAGLQKPDDPSDGAWEVLHALLGLYPGSHSVTFLITPDGDQKPHEVTAIKSLAGSTGRCNTGLKFTRRSLKTQGLSRALIETQRDLVEMGLGVRRQVGAAGKILSQQPVGVFV